VLPANSARSLSGPLRVPRFPLPMSQIVFNVPAMLLVLVFMRWPDSLSSMTCTSCLTTDDTEAAHSWAQLQQLVQRAQHGVCALRFFAGHCLAPSVQTAMQSARS
jgi:hypothetical protein